MLAGHDSSCIEKTVSASLNTEYKDWRKSFRVIAEEWSMARKDAMNFATYLVLKSLEDPQNNPFPELLTKKFWSHCYRRVMPLPMGETYHGVDFSPVMNRRFREFDRFRRDPETGAYLYRLPVFRTFHKHLANHFHVEAATNLKNHLTMNITVFLKRVIKSFLIHHKANNDDIEYYPSAEADRWIKIITKNKPMPSFEDFRNISPSKPGEVQDFFRIHYNLFRRFFQEKFIDELNDVTKIDANYESIIRYLDALLTFAKDQPALNIQTWSLLPIASHAITFFNISDWTGLSLLLQYMQAEGRRIPAMAFDKGGNLIQGRDFEEIYQNKKWKYDLWEEIFNLRRIFKGKIEGTNPRYTLGYGANTNGVMISFYMYKRRPQGRINRIPDNLKGLAFITPKTDVSRWDHGFIELKKEPRGLRATDTIVGIDPGVTDFITMAEGEVTRENRKKQLWSISNPQYHEMIGTRWQQRQEKQSRLKANIQPVYDQVLTGKTNDLDEFIDYIRSISVTRTRIFEFNKGYRHREIKAQNYGNRQSTQAIIGDIVAGVNPKVKDMPFKVGWSKKKEIMKAKRRARRLEERHERRTGRTVVAYGDASINSSMKNFAGLPQKTIQRVIARKSLVVRTDEYLTSQKCSQCGEQLFPLTEAREFFKCTHRKKFFRERPPGKRSKKVQWCVDENWEKICVAVACNARQQQRFKKLIWSLKMCMKCKMQGTKPLVIDRDNNASENFVHIMDNYISSGCDINSRPEYLKRDS